MVVAWPVVFVTANLFAAFLKPAVNGAAWVSDVCESVCVTYAFCDTKKPFFDAQVDYKRLQCVCVNVCVCVCMCVWVCA